MISVKPFPAIRPTRDKVHLVASRSYVSYKPAALKRKLTENPYSFIHIINPEFGQAIKTKPNSPERFKKVAERFRSFQKEAVLVKDRQACFYLYQQITPDASFKGVICGVSTRDYSEGRIKIHEQTLTHREEIFCKYLDICGFNAEPVLLTYRENLATLDAFFATKMLERPEYDFSSTDRIRHRLWLIESRWEQEAINQAFSKVNELYIADGHHRMASSALLGKKRKAENSNHSGDEMYNYALAMLMSAENLRIAPFLRIIKNNFEISDEELLRQLREDFDVEPCPDCYRPIAKRIFGLRLKSGWYQLRLKSVPRAERATDHLDPVLLTRYVLEPLFGIFDQKTDNRILFAPDKGDITSFELEVDREKFKAIFTSYPVSAEELFEVSDASEIMPPKSTYIEPKLRSGLTIMDLD
jgi:uncharacterized protein (DUF1015 family)